MRVVHPTSNTVQLQIAARQFLPAGRSGPTIWLTGASHIGESNYFRALQKHLDSQALVLFEGIRDGDGEFPKKRKAAAKASAREESATGAPLEAESELGSIQFTLAESLGLVFQLEAIDYDRPHFRNSDLTVQELTALMSPESEGGVDAAPGQNAFAELMQAMDGSSLLGTVLQAGFRLLGTSAKLQALSKVALIETLGQMKGDLAQMRGLPPELQRLMKVLIEARNNAVLKDVKVQLAKRNPPKSISVFYGAAHMHHLQRQLMAELKYRPAKELWLTAISVDTRKAGLAKAELEMIRSVVQWQVQALQP
jgi:hypothetical protein